MADLRIKTITGVEAVAQQTALEALKANLRGELLTSECAGYAEARSIWNAMIDRRPALIIRCVGAADVIRAVDFARKNELLLAVRAAYRPEVWKRLVEIKTKWDPKNLFRMNQNIKPSL
jgi:FAD/FMN-containing dehydrogenase